MEALNRKLAAHLVPVSAGRGPAGKEDPGHFNRTARNERGPVQVHMDPQLTLKEIQRARLGLSPLFPVFMLS